MAMSESEFSKKCPKIYQSIKEDEKEYKLYGIKFKTHTVYALHSWVNRIENSSSLELFSFRQHQVEKHLTMIILN